MDGSKILSILTAALLLISVSTIQVNTVFTTVYAENTSETPTLKFLANELIDIANKSKVKVEEIFDELKTQYMGVPREAEELYVEGVKLLNDAISCRDNGDYANACSYALKAMQKFKLALQTAYKFALRVETKEEEEKAFNLVCLRTAISRAYDFADRIEALANSTEEKFGVNLTTVKNEVEDARVHLNNAESLLDEGKINEAAKELATARGILGRCVGEIHSTTKKLTIPRAERYLNQVRERLQAHVEQMSRFLNRYRVSEMLQNASYSITTAQEYIKKGDVENALKEIEKAKGYVEKSVDEVKSLEPDTAKMIKMAEKFEVRLRLLEGMLKHAKIKGPELAAIKEKLGEAKSLAARLSNQIRNQKIGEAEETVKFLEELLKNIEENISSRSS